MDHTQKKYESGRGGTSLRQWIPNKSIALICIHQLKVLPNDDQLIQKVQIMTAKDREKKFFKRPVHKLVLLLAK